MACPVLLFCWVVVYICEGDERVRVINRNHFSKVRPVLYIIFGHVFVAIAHVNLVAE